MEQCVHILFLCIYGQILYLLMVLTIEEFSSFNLVSRITIVDNSGVFLIKRVVNANLEARLFLLYDFYVEIYYNCKKRKIIKAEPVTNKQWLNAFYMGIVNRFHFC